MTSHPEWKEQYAQTAYGAGRPARVFFHHVHPIFDGTAHCSLSVVLDMQTVTDKQPPDEIYCRMCGRKEQNFSRVTDGEKAQKHD